MSGTSGWRNRSVKFRGKAKNNGGTHIVKTKLPPSMSWTGLIGFYSCNDSHFIVSGDKVWE